MGWTGVDEYDEGNEVGQRFPDQFEQTYGRRPQRCVPVVNRDVAVTLLHALTDAHPLSPLGLKDALERVKSIPAASGAPGTRVSFGKWVRRGWTGSGYLVARQLDQDRSAHGLWLDSGSEAGATRQSWRKRPACVEWTMRMIMIHHSSNSTSNRHGCLCPLLWTARYCDALSQSRLAGAGRIDKLRNQSESYWLAGRCSA